MASSAIKLDSGNIPKFDGSNFQLWKFSVTILLKAEKLMAVVDGTEEEPTDKTSTQWKTWDTNNSKAQVVLLSTLTQNQIQHLINCENAAQMWARLVAIHEQKTEISKELLWQKFYEYKMHENENIAQHISNIELLVRQLKDVKEEISQSAICSKAISSLPSRYNVFRTAWDSVSMEQQTFENLAARLLKEETRMTSDDSEVNRLALQVKALQSKLEANNRISKKPDIKDLKRNSSCNYCKRKGHWSRECRKRIADMKSKYKQGHSTDAATDSAYVCDFSLHLSISEVGKTEWICDSGASMHMTGEKHMFLKLEPLSEPIYVRIANDKLIPAAGKGLIEIKAFVEDQWEDRTLNNVLYIPELSHSLFSVGVMTDKNFTFHSFKNVCEFRNSTGKLSCVGTRKDNLWVMKFKMKPAPEPTSSCNLATKCTLKLWHDRLGHVNCNTIKQTVGLVKNLNLDDTKDFICETCQYGKQTRKPHKTLTRERTEKPGEMIHTDVCGPINVPSPSGSRYFVLFKDDCSGYCTVYFLKHKSDVINKFKEYKALIENQTGNNIKILRSDQGKGEYMNKDLQNFLKDNGILHECSAPYTPQQNGRSERQLRTIVESARSMLINKNIIQELWSEAVNTAVYILNRTASSQIKNITPYEKWFGRKPDLRNIRVFGSTAYMSIQPQFRKKFDAKSRKLLFVGYDGYSSNYRLWDSDKRRIEVSCNVNFNENDELKINVESFTLEFGPEFTIFENTQGNEIEEFDPNKSEEQIQPTDQEEINEDSDEEEYYDVDVTEINDRQLRDRSKLPKPNYAEFANYCTIFEPTNYKNAIDCEDSHRWKLAMDQEMEALKLNNTWDLVNVPNNAKIIDNKWVFRIKSDQDGNPIRFKARLVARGFMQEKGIDYEDTFAPVVRYDSIRILLALAAENDCHLANFDVQSAFLYGDLSECIYMKQPVGFENKKRPELVCKLNKSLYGLKQSPKCWNRKFVSFLSTYDFKQLKTDQCVFVGNFLNYEVYLAIYVDDGLLMSKSQSAINELINILQQMFNITVQINKSIIQFVGLQIEQDINEGTVAIHQKVYTKKVLEKFKMTDVKPLKIPAEPGNPLSSGNNININNVIPYREAVGSLIFLASTSRPDITFAVNQVSRFFNSWTDEHWQAVKRIFRYLVHTINYKIIYSKTEKIKVEGYTDADYAGCLDTRKSTSGYVFLLANSPITWKSQKQNVVAQSTTEAEYLALALGVKEALWLKHFLGELRIGIPPIKIGVDNQSAIKLTQAQQLHNRTKHIDIKVHFVRDECERGNISVYYINSSDQLADLFTKALSKTVFNRLLNQLNVSMV